MKHEWRKKEKKDYLPKNKLPKGYFDYTVYPLEGIW